MAFARASAIRGALNSVRASRSAASRPQLLRQIARRGYASGHGHESTKAGGDLPWAIGAVAVTVPSCWFLMQSPPEGAHGDHADSHGKSHDDNDEKPAATKSEGEEPTEPESESEDESGADTPVTSDDEAEVVKKEVPDAKGGSKKRIESQKGKKQGEADPNSEANAPENSSQDKAASSKEAGDQNSQSGKQEGLSNTDTKHSTDITNEEQSEKPEGAPETAKLKGTVDAQRPQK
ncbi:MAG: hypothetical protein M1818_001721 [Claussenomyces sp. TS43310]|nr:MAG: hypothetical protein M1818_001721 [Claussenomyces sp. TS43310]